MTIALGMHCNVDEEVEVNPAAEKRLHSHQEEEDDTGAPDVECRWVVVLSSLIELGRLVGLCSCDGVCHKGRRAVGILHRGAVTAELCTSKVLHAEEEMELSVARSDCKRADEL